MKKLNKKGFTLVELLAVIVVLALLMVVAASSIGSALTNSKKNTLKTEAQKIITNVYQNAYSQYMLNSNIGKLTGYNGITGYGLDTANSGKGVVAVDSGAYIIRDTDGEYQYAVKVDTVGNIISYCVNYKPAYVSSTYTAELSISESPAEGKTILGEGAYSISDDATIKDSACSIITASR